MISTPLIAGKLRLVLVTVLTVMYVFLAIFAGTASAGPVRVEVIDPDDSGRISAASKLRSADTREFSSDGSKLQDRLNSQPLRPELAVVIDQLRNDSDYLLYQIDGRRVRMLAGVRLGDVKLRNPKNEREAYKAVLSFLKRYSTLFSFPEGQVKRLQQNIQRTGWQSGTDLKRLSLHQYHKRLAVVDGHFAAIFDQNGRLLFLQGAPFSVNDLPENTTPRVHKRSASSIAIREIMREKKQSLAHQLSRSEKEIFKRIYDPTKLDSKTRLVVSGARRALLWEVNILHKDGLAIDRTILVDANDGAIVESHDNIYAGAKLVEVRAFKHVDGQKNDHPSWVNPETDTLAINIDLDTLEGYPGVCIARLQRLGSGRARMWNARLTGGTPEDPMFGATMTVTPCDDASSLQLFSQNPEDGSGIDSTYRFNEQNAFVWAQKLKTQFDIWGRKPGGDYWHYPVKGGRDVNVEIVVNGDASSEIAWCGASVMHGCFSSKRPDSWFEGVADPTDSWFEGVADPKVVFFFNSAGNSSSPQFVGAEHSGSYSIIGHEVGHFLSWMYGGWEESSTSNMRRSLSEGFSMAIPAMWAKSRWGTAIAYTDSNDVTSGSIIDGSQWQHHSSGTGSDHSAISCDDNNAYQLAWPWVEAMWELANNRYGSTGKSIWSGHANAIDNTADLMMAAMWILGGVSDVDWNRVVTTQLFWQWYRTVVGIEKGGTSTTLTKTRDVFDHHGLLDPCLE